MSDSIDAIIEETTQVNNIPVKPAHEYIEICTDCTGHVTPCNDTASTPILNVDGDSSVTENHGTDEPAVTENHGTETVETSEITPVIEVTSSNAIKYDTELTEYMDSAFNTLTSLVTGINVGPDNWVLLLTKAMYVVSLIKSLDTDKKVRLSVELVIRYLDEYTTLDDAILIGIKSSVHSMCIAMLNNSGILRSKITRPAVISGDPDILVTPLQITDLVIKRLINLVKSRNLDMAGIKSMFPELIILCIVTVEKYPHFTGLEKKNLVMQIIQKLLTDYIPSAFNISNAEQQGLNVLSQSLPFLVDTLVNVGRGKTNYKFDFTNPETLTKLQLLSICLLSCVKRRGAVQGSGPGLMF